MQAETPRGRRPFCIEVAGTCETNDNNNDTHTDCGTDTKTRWVGNDMKMVWKWYGNCVEMVWNASTGSYICMLPKEDLPQLRSPRNKAVEVELLHPG